MLTPNALLLITLLSQTTPSPAETTPPAESTPAVEMSATEAATRAAEAAAAAAASAAESTRRLADTADRIAAAMGAAPAIGGSAPVPAPVEPQRWTGSVGVGLISLTGNANTLTVTANALAEYKSTDWVVIGKASGAYGTSAAPGEDERTIVAEAAAGSVRGERRFSSVLSSYALFGAETNHLASLELRTVAELGMGIVLLDDRVQEKERAFLRVDVAARYSYDYRFQYYPVKMNLENVVMLAPGAGLTFRYALNDSVSISEVAEVLPNVLGDARLVAKSNTKLLANLTTRLAFNVAFGVTYDSAPAEGKVSTDTALTVGLEVKI